MERHPKIAYTNYGKLNNVSFHSLIQRNEGKRRTHPTKELTSGPVICISPPMEAAITS